MTVKELVINDLRDILPLSETTREGLDRLTITEIMALKKDIEQGLKRAVQDL